MYRRIYIYIYIFFLLLRRWTLAGRTRVQFQKNFVKVNFLIVRVDLALQLSGHPLTSKARVQFPGR